MGASDFKLFELLKSLYKSLTSAIDGHHEFKVELGVRQGGPESPLLFNLYLDYVMRAVKCECNKQKIKFTKLNFSIPRSALASNRILGLYGQHNLDWIGYADDLVMTFDSTHDLKKGLNIINNLFKRFGLSINATKTRSMIINFEQNESEYPNTISTLDGVNIENVKVFKYLGCQIHYKEQTTGNAEINARLDMAEIAFYQHGKKFMNKQINLTTRVDILNSLVRSRLTYGCQVWNLTQRQLNQLNASYMQMLRKMIKRFTK